ncbi:MAG: cation:proton antiporter [Nodularia sp. (in: Bacteria)]|nr:MAG: cation:proton antiporter [Nodularia sp. (in: cyanobacteria)]
MINLTIAWVLIPMFFGLIIYLIPKFDRYIAVTVAIFSTVYALQLFFTQLPFTLTLLGNFGVAIMIDELSGYFILTNALVTIAVIVYCWNTGKSAFFYTQLIILHGCVNSAFICADFISLYVALEVIGIAVFLLVSYPRSDRSIWIALRYMFVSNTAMLFYLVGTVLLYQSNRSFAFTGLSTAPTQAIALIFVGLLTKGGIFISGLWSPLTNSESETPVSALLSGIVEKAGIFPLARCVLMFNEIDPILRILAGGTIFLGTVYAIAEKDTKRTLAFSTIAQLGWILAAPGVGGMYALAHGLAKTAIFLIVGNFPSRNFQELKATSIDTRLWIALLIPCLSISGCPLFIGFGAKILTLDNLLPWQTIIMNIGAVGTVIVYAKFLFLPHGQETEIRPSFWPPIILLTVALIATNSFDFQAYTMINVVKSLIIIAIGWLAHLLIFQRYILNLPRVLEQFEHLIGMMSVILLSLFWLLTVR